MHAFFNNFITRRSTLIQLAKQFDNCLGRKEKKEREADAGDLYTDVPCATNCGIESQFRVYTNEKFREVQIQFRAKANCVASCIERVPGFVVYEVGEDISPKRRNIYKRRHTSIKSSYNEPSLEPRNINYDVMISRAKVHYEDASGNDVLTAMVHSAYDKLEADMKEYKRNSEVECTVRHNDGSMKLLTELQTPKPIRSRGRPKKRLGSALDKKIANKKKKKEKKSG
ncbi:hypothetical protein PIB30_074970 [Stylosanthes scabra]|uniref:Protein FAR1-RELATED SEQUENCE n=1 Tax=Stylosanthes scabra TaxID=79078 RepID=A0ABU6UQX6_9FABA|nr:hypothetical protein [Stylosanthes scabra]